MFPIPFNFPFRKSNGDISTIGAEISAGGGGSSYTLPTASANTKGGVKVGEGLTMDGEVLKNTNPTPATPYTLPVASADTLGGVKVGSNLSIDENGVLSASGGGGGGGSVYLHSIHLSISSGVGNANILIPANNNTPFTLSTLHTYMGTNRHLYTVSGSDGVEMWFGSESSDNVTLKKSGTSESGTTTITDTVFPI